MARKTREQIQAACVHHWLLGEPGETTPARCTKCGAARAFSGGNVADYGSWKNWNERSTAYLRELSERLSVEDDYR